MKKTTLFSFLAIIFFGFLLTGCQQDDQEIQIEQEKTTVKYDKRVYELSKDPEVQAELQFMKDHMSIDLFSIEIIKVGDYKGSYSQRNDFDGLLMRREGIQKIMKEHYLQENNNSGEIQARHRKNRYNVMATSGVKNIRYVVISGSSTVPNNWKTAVNSARQKWNNLGKSLSFNTPVNGSYSSSNTVNIVYQSLSARFGPTFMTTTAYAILPIPGESIGPEIIINTDMDLAQNLTPNQKIFVIVHELGHVIGFEHTNTSDGSLIVTGNSTCDHSSDTQSVLRTGWSSVPAWPSSGTAFTLCDQLAFDLFYGSLA